MNIRELRDALNEQLEAGVHPSTEVVFADNGGERYLLISEVTSPITSDYDCWVTLFVSDEEANSRSTPCHFQNEPQPPVSRNFGIPLPHYTAEQLDRKARSLFP